MAEEHAEKITARNNRFFLSGFPNAAYGDLVSLRTKFSF
jgi:hypothetical protein